MLCEKKMIGSEPNAYIVVMMMFYLGGAAYYAPDRLILGRIGYYRPELCPIQNIGLGVT